MYRTIETSIWYDPKIKKLSIPDKFLFLYLITNSHAHMSGIYYISLRTISAEALISESQLIKSLDRLAKVSDLANQGSKNSLSIPYQYPIQGDSSIGLVFYDFDFEVVWVKNMLKHQGRGDKIKKGVENHLESLHKCPLIKVFSEYYNLIQWGSINTPSIPYDIPHRNKEQNQNKVQKQQNKKHQTFPENGVYPKFNDFWNAYPRKIRKKDALKIWIKDKLEEKATLIISDVLNRVTQDSQWQISQYIPHPATYLNKTGWEDEVTPILTTGGKANAAYQVSDRITTRQAKVIEAEREYIESRRSNEYEIPTVD